LTDWDRRFLHSLRQHPSAPRFNYACGDMLDDEDLGWVHRFEQVLRASSPRWEPGCPPEWVEEFAEKCLRQVPYYRDRAPGRGATSGPAGSLLSRLPSLSRAALRDHWRAFLPDGICQQAMVHYYTSGTTGNRLEVPSHPVTAACYLPLLRKALELHGVNLEGGSGRVSLMMLSLQKTALIYPAISRFLEGAAFLKLNLHPESWHKPEDCREYLLAHAPEIVTGTPVSLSELARLQISLRPKALISTSMAMLPGTRRELEREFECPIVDLYSMTECRCIAVRDPLKEDAYPLLAHDVYVEILDPEGHPCPPGVRGEITLTGGRNPYQPLLRYRTGDFAAMQWKDQHPRLVGVAGRAPVRFFRSDGSWLNNIDVTGYLQDLPLRRFSLHQFADLSLRLLYQPGLVSRQELECRLRRALGDDLKLEILEASSGELLENKWINYSSDLPS